MTQAIVAESRRGQHPFLLRLAANPQGALRVAVLVLFASLALYAIVILNPNNEYSLQSYILIAVMIVLLANPIALYSAALNDTHQEVYAPGFDQIRMTELSNVALVQGLTLLTFARRRKLLAVILGLSPLAFFLTFIYQAYPNFFYCSSQIGSCDLSYAAESPLRAIAIAGLLVGLLVLANFLAVGLGVALGSLVRYKDLGKIIGAPLLIIGAVFSPIILFWTYGSVEQNYFVAAFVFYVVLSLVTIGLLNVAVAHIRRS
jgi:hypothetical protein